VKYKEALLYRRYDNRVRCFTCIRRCILREKASGFCGNYMNIEGRLYNIGYGLISAHESRPIEIKPLFHFHPGSTAYTFSGWGCNFLCIWCQNYSLSKVKPLEIVSDYIPPENMVRYALLKGDDGLCASFNEPTIHLEYLVDVFRIGRSKGLYNVMVTNASYTREALETLIEAGLDAVSVDIKGCPKSYRRFQGIANPIEILENMRYAKENGVHLETVFLIVPKANDGLDCIKWVINSHLKYLGPDTPIHINRYYPAYRYFEPPTPMETLYRAYEYARELGIKYVYIGNIIDTNYMNTYCPRCGKPVILRSQYSTLKCNLTEDGKCKFCGEKIELIGRCRETRLI